MDLCFAVQLVIDTKRKWPTQRRPPPTTVHHITIHSLNCFPSLIWSLTMSSLLSSNSSLDKTTTMTTRHAHRELTSIISSIIDHGSWCTHTTTGLSTDHPTADDGTNISTRTRRRHLYPTRTDTTTWHPPFSAGHRRQTSTNPFGDDIDDNAGQSTTAATTTPENWRLTAWCIDELPQSISWINLL